MKPLVEIKQFDLVNHLSNSLYDVYRNTKLIKIIDKINCIEFWSNEEEIKHHSIDEVISMRIEDEHEDFYQRYHYGLGNF